jgi:hypothetical protein
MCLAATFLALYLFSTGPVAWATNDAFHKPYLPDEAHILYLPLVPLLRIECISRVYLWWTAYIWQGAPAGYTTL